MWSKVRRTFFLRIPFRLFSADPKQYAASKTRTAYKPPSQIGAIIKSNTNELLNQEEKDHFHSFVKEAAAGLHRNYEKDTAKVKSETRKFVTHICHTLDQTSLSLFIRHLSQLQKNLTTPEHKVTPNSFLPFLDRLKHLGASREIINVVLRHLGAINIKELNKHEILQEYQKVAQESKAEEQLRLQEIKQFADDVVPRTRFIFDNYNLESEKSAASSGTPSSVDKDFEKTKNYFSFFNQEKLMIKPQENFKNVEEMMSFLPLDYYVLLEEGYDKVTQAEPPRSRCIYFKNLPLLYRKRSVLNNFKVFRAVFGDVLTPSFFESPHFSLQPSLDIMKHSLELYFGKVKYHRVLNFSQESLKKRVEKLKSNASEENLQDQITEFEHLFSSLFEREAGSQQSELSESEQIQTNLDTTGKIEYEAKSFEELLKVVAQNWEGEQRRMSSDTRSIDILHSPVQSYQEDVTQSKLLGLLKNRKVARPNIMREVKNDLNFKVRQRYGLDKPILANGVLEFETYEAKLKMLLSPLYKFGLYHFFNNIEFFDCDFANVLQLKSSTFDKKTLEECLLQINEMLKRGGYKQRFQTASKTKTDYLTLGKLKHYPDFRLGDIKVTSTQPIILRFKSFENAYRALLALARVSKKKTELEDFRVTLQTPYIRYYGGEFQTQFEKCIRDRFEGLDHTIKMRSDYAQRFSKESFGESHDITQEFYQKMQEAQSESDQQGGGPILSLRKLKQFFPDVPEPEKKPVTTPKLTKPKRVGQKSQQKGKAQEEEKKIEEEPKEKSRPIEQVKNTKGKKKSSSKQKTKTKEKSGEEVGRSKAKKKKKE